MSHEEVAELLRKSIDLCGKAMEGETDFVTVERLTDVRNEIKFAIRLLEKLGSPFISVSKRPDERELTPGRRHAGDA